MRLEGVKGHTVGCYPETVVETLLKIQELRQGGLVMEQIKSKILANTSETDNNLISLEELINRARVAGFIFGAGKPSFLLHYYTQLGILPKAVRLRLNGIKGHTVGCYPAEAVETLLKIQKLRREGVAVKDIAQTLGNEGIKPAARREEAETLEILRVAAQAPVRYQAETEAGRLAGYFQPPPPERQETRYKIQETKKTQDAKETKEKRSWKSFAYTLPAVLATILLLLTTGLNIYITSYQKKVASDRNLQAVLAESSSQNFLDIRADTDVSGRLTVWGKDVLTEATLASSSPYLSNLNQSLSTTATPTFANLTLTAGKIVLEDKTQTLKNKTIDGGSNTLTNISNSSLSNSKVTVTAGTNLTGGGDVVLGDSTTIGLKDNINIASLSATSVFVNGDATVAGNLLPGTNSANDLGSSDHYWHSLYVNNIYGPPVGSFWFWQRAAGAVAPTNITDDLLLGSTATATAQIALNATNGNITTKGTINGLGITSATIDTGTWQATAIGTQYGGTGQNWSSVAQGNLPYFSASGTMGTLAPDTVNKLLTTGGAGANPSWQSLVNLLSAGTDISFGGSEVVTVNDTATLNTVTGRGATTANAITLTGAGTALTVSNNATVSGTLGVGGEASISGKLILGSNTAQINATSNNDLQLGFQNTGTVRFLNTSNYLDASGNFYLSGNLIASGTTVGFWQRTAGSLAPINITDDLNLGATGTSSALVHFGGTSGQGNFINTGAGVGIGTTDTTEMLNVNGRLLLSQVSAPGVLTDKLYNLGGALTWAGNAVCTAAGNCAGTASALGGSGGAGYISKWSGTYSLTTSPLYVDGSGQVGIGTTSPAAQFAVGANSGLTINGTGDIVARTFNGNTIATGSATFTIPASGTAALGTGTANQVAYWSGTNTLTSEAQLAPSRGGTGADWSLVAQGSLPYFSGTGTLSTLGAGTANQVLTTGGGGADPGWTNIASLVTQTGNISITGTQTLSVNTVMNPTFSTSVTTPLIYGGTGAGSTLTLAGTSNGSPVNAYVLLNPAGQGNVGIGTTNPVTTLHVYNAGGNDNGDVQISGTTNPSIALVDTGVQGYGLYIDTSDSNKLKLTNANAGVSAGTPLMTITSAGNVGIGTTGPSKLLDVYKSQSSVTDESQAAAAFGVTTTGGIYGYITPNQTGKTVTFAGVRGGQANDVSLLFNPAGGNVGIGTTGPLGKLDVGNQMYVQSNGTIESPGSKNTTNGMIETYYNAGDRYGLGQLSNGVTALYTSDAYSPSSIQFGRIDSSNNFISLMDITHGGNVGIGTTSPGYLLTVNSSTPGCNGCTAWTNYSDIRLKENIASVSGGILDKILQLNPVTFNYNDTYYTQTGYSRPDGQTPTYTGFIAQQLQTIFPEMVSTSSNGYLDTNLSNLQIYLVKGMQEQQGEIASQSADIATMSATLSAWNDLLGTPSASLADSVAHLDGLSADISTLMADNLQIKSDIELLKEQMATVSANLAQVQSQTASNSASLASLSPLSNLSILSDLEVSTVSASFANFSDTLKVVGKTDLADTNIGGSLTVGLLHFDDLKAEISSLTGTVTVNSNLQVAGDAEVMGSATVSGQLAVRGGIVVKDAVSGENYCLRVENGVMTNTKGDCK
ncbi:tail fiber domain-containing protein [Patescibacteria group bacterium]|nr:tail fiber domain-containing protein [Patescibacteria group bacterium]